MNGLTDRMQWIVRLLRLFASLLMISSFRPLISHRIGFCLFLLALLALTLLNDALRHRVLSDRRSDTLSLMVSLAFMALINFYWESLGADVYFIILLVEVMIGPKRLRKIPFLLLAYAYSLDMTFSVVSYRFAASLAHETANFVLTLVPIILFRYTLIERRRADELNAKLAGANDELFRRNAEIERLTQAKERARIAQELHDAMGHQLIALHMNLEFAERTLAAQPEKARAAVVKTRALAGQLMHDLRRAVHVLHDADNPDHLGDAVQHLLRELNTSGQLTLHLHSDEALESQPKAVKSCLYKAVREALTNGLRHGQANVFDIDLRQLAECVQMRVTNNGAAPETVTASDGLKGITARFQSLGGTVDFRSSLAGGFEVCGMIPLAEPCSESEDE